MEMSTNTTKDTKGFSIIEIVIVVIIVALIAAVGWIAFDKLRAKDSTTANKSSSTSAQENSSTTAKTAAATKTVTVTVPTGTTSTGINLSVPERWSVTTPKNELPDSAIQATIDGHTYQIQPFFASDFNDPTTGAVTSSYAHFTADYASNNNTILKTITTTSGDTLYLVKSSLNDVVLRTCTSLTDTTCYPSHYAGDLPLIVRLSSYDSPDAQNYTGLTNFDSASTKEAISDFAIIAQSIAK